jgi:polyisoprenyl-phosphate glycosyltransferase
MSKKHIAILGPCYNEAGNVEEYIQRIHAVMAKFPQYDYSIWFIDNASEDGTVDILRRLGAADRRIKVIVNARNFGHIRSPMHALLQVTGDAIIGLTTDLQDPPEIIERFIPEWERGYLIVLGVKTTSDESSLMFWLRKTYYKQLAQLSQMQMYENATGIGLFDRKVIEILRSFQDPYPYFRGMLAEIGLPAARVEYHQKNRTRGITKNNWYTLLDIALLGMTNHTKVPLRLATIVGFASSLGSLLLAILYFVLKLVFWQSFAFGSAPLIIGLFFLGSVQLFFTGIMGEYLGAVYTQTQKRPLVIEKERINC